MCIEKNTIFAAVFRRKEEADWRIGGRVKPLFCCFLVSFWMRVFARKEGIKLPIDRYTYDKQAKNTGTVASGFV